MQWCRMSWIFFCHQQQKQINKLDQKKKEQLKTWKQFVFFSAGLSIAWSSFKLSRCVIKILHQKCSLRARERANAISDDTWHKTVNQSSSKNRKSLPVSVLVLFRRYSNFFRSPLMFCSESNEANEFCLRMKWWSYFDFWRKKKVLNNLLSSSESALTQKRKN